MKKILTVFVLCCLLLGAFSISAFAQDNYGVMPCYDNVSRILLDLTFDGTAGNVLGTATKVSGVTSLEGTIELYEEIGGEWVSAGSWSNDTTGRNLVVSADFTATANRRYKAVFTITAYMDENGKWIDIDNALTLNENDYSANNKSEIKFANKSGSGGLVSIKDGEYKIDFTPLNTNKVSVVIENPQSNNSRKFEDVSKLNNLISRAIYADVYDGIDIEYILVGNNIKENIIVKQKQDEYTYSFELKLNKLSAELVNGAIILSDYDTGEQVYEIPAPYMLDANGEYSNSVTYTLTQNSKWKYTLTVTASTDWINAENREFPVTIDPTIIEDTSIIDKYVTVYTDMYPEEDASSYMSLIVGNFIGGSDVPTFIKFDNLADNYDANIPETALLLKAEMVFLCSSALGGENEPCIGIYEATSDWTQSLTYAGSRSFYNEQNPLDTLTVSTTGTLKWNITSAYKNWIENEENNHGVCLRAIDLPSTVSASIHMYSSENVDSVPSIEITYVDTLGIEWYNGVVSSTLGDKGVSYINLYNGALTYVQTLTTIDSFNYDISLVYNSATKNWRYSFEENIVYLNYDGIERYIWQDTDGTMHSFTPYMQKNAWGAYVYYEEDSNGNLWQVNSPTVFYPEDDIDYVLTKTADGDFILKNYDGTQKFFNKCGKLKKICSVTGDMLYFYYISGDGGQSPRLSSIAYKTFDGAVLELIRFEYKTQYNKLWYIYDVQNQMEININWKTTLKIDNISYDIANQDLSNTVSFTYSQHSFLFGAIDSYANEEIEYSMYTSGKYIAVKRFSNNLQEEYEMVYNTGYTTVTDGGTDLESDEDNLVTIVRFDSKGRIINNPVNNEENICDYDDSILPEESYYYVVYNQNVYNEPFNSADDAAIYFAKKYYRSSYYIRHEYGAMIYSVTKNNTTTYNFTNIVYGGVHSVTINMNVDTGGTFVGDIHTHPYDNNYSDEDKNLDRGYGYLVVSTLKIKKLNYATGEENNSTINFYPNELTTREKELLCDRFKASWQAHVSYDCEALSDCDNHAEEWPREIPST